MKKLLRGKKIPSFTGISCDSRKIKPGYAFVAITGFNKDGNKYIEEAIKKGASVVFTEKITNFKSKTPIIRVKDTRFLLGQLAAKFFDFPSHKLKLIGVTGTNGKTSTTHLIYNLLNYNQEKAGLIGTVNIDTGNKIQTGNLTTPPPVILQKSLREMVNNKLKYACMEVSSHGIKLKRIEGTRFAIKVGTNISIDHFDLHPNFSDYITVKKSFLQDNNYNNLVLINQDNTYLQSFGKVAKNQINFGIKTKAEIKAIKINHWDKGSQFIYQLSSPLQRDNGKFIYPCKIPVKTNMLGEHNIYNALVAITIGLYYGLSPDKIQKFFYTFSGIWRRLQTIYKKDFTIIDDCAHNPGSYEAIFKTVKKMNYQKIYIINSLRGNRGIEINQKNAETIISYLPLLKNYQLITTNCLDVVKPIDLVTKAEEEIFLQTLHKYKINSTHFHELKPALKSILKKAAKNDLILLLGPHAMDHAGEMILKMI